MDLHKLFHEVAEACKSGHFLVLAGMLGIFKLTSGFKQMDKSCGLSDAVGDNILPKNILISLSSRKGY